MGYEEKTITYPTVKKQLSKVVVDQVINQINTSGIMTKICMPMMIQDAWWNYQINLDGKKVKFRNPPDACMDDFNKIDKLIDSAVK